MGINIPTRDELIGNKLKPDELAKYVGKFNVCIYLKIRRINEHAQFLIYLNFMEFYAKK